MTDEQKDQTDKAAPEDAEGGIPAVDDPEFNSYLEAALNADCLHCRIKGVAWAHASARAKAAGEKLAGINIDEAAKAAAKFAGEMLAGVPDKPERGEMLGEVVAIVIAFAMMGGQMPAAVVMNAPPDGPPPGKMN